jgi:hypothetical protein
MYEEWDLYRTVKADSSERILFWTAVISREAPDPLGRPRHAPFAVSQDQRALRQWCAKIERMLLGWRISAIQIREV